MPSRLKSNLQLVLVALVMWILLLLGLAVAAYVVLSDIPIHTHSLFSHYPDPDRPGHFKGFTVSTLEIGEHSAFALALLVGAAWIALFLRRKGNAERGILEPSAEQL